MPKYCTHCGAELAADVRFCPNCGRSRPQSGNRQYMRNNDVVRHRSSGGIWKFFAGTAVGAFLMNFFGSSSSASASNANHTETVEHLRDTVVYENDKYGEDYLYEDGYEAGYEYGYEDCAEDYNDGYDDYADDGYDDYADDGYYDDDE